MGAIRALVGDGSSGCGWLLKTIQKNSKLFRFLRIIMSDYYNTITTFRSHVDRLNDIQASFTKLNTTLNKISSEIQDIIESEFLPEKKEILSTILDEASECLRDIKISSRSTELLYNKCKAINFTGDMHVDIDYVIDYSNKIAELMHTHMAYTDKLDTLSNKIGDELVGKL